MANNNRPDRGRNRKSGNVSTTLSAIEEREQLARDLRLKPRTKAFVDELLNDKSISQTEAYIRTHETNNRNVAAKEASKLVRKRNVSIYKASHVKKAKERIVSLVDTSNESIALKASQDILDRTEGKAIQKTENTSKVVEVKLDLTGVRIGSHYIPNQSN